MGREFYVMAPGFNASPAVSFLNSRIGARASDLHGPDTAGAEKEFASVPMTPFVSFKLE